MRQLMLSVLVMAVSIGLGLFSAIAADTPTPATSPASASPQIDIVHPGDEQSETSHKHKGDQDETGDWTDRTYRHSVSGWFSWELKVDPDHANELWVTYAGVDKRTFKILVDDKLLSDKAQPGNDNDFYEQKYPLPADMTSGKQTITVKFQAIGDGYAGGVFDIRTMRAVGPATAPATAPTAP
jgi:hypothetical protein